MRGEGALCVRSRGFVRWRAACVAALVSWAGGYGAQAVAAPVVPQAQTQPEPQVLEGSESERGGSANAVALALEVENGEGVLLKVKTGQPFFINQIDLRAAVTGVTQDEGVSGLRRQGDFAALNWQGIKQVDQEPVPLANGDGTFTRRRFYREAKWMDDTSIITVWPMDARNRLTGQPIVLNIGRNDQRRPSDDFFIRRLRAIQTTHDCRTLTDCTGARNFTEEALVELRNARTGATPFTLSRDTTQLKLYWSARPGLPYTIPVVQVDKPTYGYGVSVDIKALTPPRFNGTYAAGSQITFQLTLKDGNGKRLHPVGSLPTYNEVIFGTNEPGIQYYRAFFDATTTYYRRKHRERMMMTQLIGPAQKIQPVRSIVELEEFLGPQDVQTVATLDRDGVYSQFQTFPPANDLFGGAFDPTHAGWAAPVSDTWTYTLPANATPGSYLVTVKGRRVYLGEDIPYSRTITLQVDTPKPTQATLTTGPCTSCHSEGGELARLLHASDNRAACAGCHAPLGFELEGPIFVRTHFIHGRSDRFDAPKQQCNSCHLTAESIQRTSKAACLSCHKSYPDSHVKQFGPIESMYVGGGRESFQQCTGSCHKTHPGSRL
ncbi:hypothetical protein MEBOL_004161 [Melittangium boletus DSM 14713]|uniref:Doubled CXXCH motif domain-containing protein n=1 Tax=Melittangium boletus DSM 14713 TaxID=1294270 RepID=A0A250IHK0_9BACT|nr:cytochrome c3 family protein [Melittangium boletus]ATB30700.1 hypothetical protein MEBOL_004161 [Melittangium boletus DSM 14713]